MTVLADTNVLLRRAQPEHPHHEAAVTSIEHMLAAGEAVCFTAQNIAEFWNAATRPAERNGMGFSVEATLAEVDVVERTLTLLEDSVAIYDEWKRLVIRHQVRGAEVHDTRLVAAMNVHCVRRILTFNAGDFARFRVEAIHPATLVG